MGRKPPLWLKDGDIVEVGLEGVGSCVNSVRFCKEDGDPRARQKYEMDETRPEFS